MTTYSRRVYIHNVTDLNPGDLVDISVISAPCWAPVAVVTDHDEDEDADDHCELGDCEAVIFFAGDDAPSPWHVTASDRDWIYARLRTDATGDDVERENTAHTEAACAARRSV